MKQARDQKSARLHAVENSESDLIMAPSTLSRGELIAQTHKTLTRLEQERVAGFENIQKVRVLLWPSR
jgi:hypothetical protein